MAVTLDPMQIILKQISYEKLEVVIKDSQESAHQSQSELGKQCNQDSIKRKHHGQSPFREFSIATCYLAFF